MLAGGVPTPGASLTPPSADQPCAQRTGAWTEARLISSLKSSKVSRRTAPASERRGPGRALCVAGCLSPVVMLLCVCVCASQLGHVNGLARMFGTLAGLALEHLHRGSIRGIGKWARSPKRARHKFGRTSALQISALGEDQRPSLPNGQAGDLIGRLGATERDRRRRIKRRRGRRNYEPELCGATLDDAPSGLRARCSGPTWGYPVGVSPPGFGPFLVQASFQWGRRWRKIASHDVCLLASDADRCV